VTRLFGTDGIRGVVGEDLTEDHARRVGRAAATVLRAHGEARPRVVVGRDTRASGPELQSALSEGIRSAGGHVVLAGVQTTPAVAFLTTDLAAASGIVISASHNPPEYNGLKFFGSSGFKLSDELEDEIERLVRTEPARDGTGSEQELADATERYVRHLEGASEAGLDGLRVVVDCANGAAVVSGPETLRRLGADVVVLFDQPDGRNINVECGATHPEVVAESVARLRADAGVAHDGDADRAMFADANGVMVDGDHVLAACALALKERGRLAGNVVVTTVMANIGFHKAMREAGVDVLTTKVGDRYVLEEMLRTGAVVGGEQSGHLIFREHATTGDGILTAVKALTFAAEAGASLGEFVNVMRRYPQVLENVPVRRPGALEDAPEIWEAVRRAERSLGEGGRVLVRASGTEPLVRVMVEAETEHDARTHADAIADVVRARLVGGEKT
jgi:phosphoglucosamine mutase